jgi:hypothetical protein
MAKRRRLKISETFEERLAEEARFFRQEAEKLPPGTPRELLLRRASRDRLADQRLAQVTGLTAARCHRDFDSPGMRTEQTVKSSAAALNPSLSAPRAEKTASRRARSTFEPGRL